MDLTNNNGTPTTTPPDSSDNDTPPHTHQINPLSYPPNGTLKKFHYPYHHHRHGHHHHRQFGAGGGTNPVAAAVVVYRECLKNHAANLGGHALDGCGEFMASPNANPSDPASLKCAACGCHRNFHRREIDDHRFSNSQHFLDFRRPSSPPSQMLLALSNAAQETQQQQNHHQVATPVTPTAAKTENHLSGRKRFRTKFSQEQKERMFSFSEKLGWKMQKSDDSMIREFCNEIGVGKGVLKVWMHNNKNKKDIVIVGGGNGGNINGGGDRDNNNNNNNNINNVNDNNNGSSHDQNNAAVHLQASTTTAGSISSPSS
ncbi:hypothetical protein M9H77_09984 [Catharanthus roseus]|uniref:Uncharacterized protein n=1 Tax=Catharanthus roseus TaxID=4058 RepID=A0ACC0C2J2_CATRO|nr:hypothetical protein M9H77_09984 [Catharanthus roseus]